MPFELVIRYLGLGANCSNCGRSRETTRYTIRQGEQRLQEFRLCDACQDKGFAVQFDPPKASSATSRSARKQRIKISRKLEREVAADIKGSTTPGSGNQDTKADVRKVDEWRIEHKYTDSVKGYRVQVLDLSTVVHHANLAGEWPALVLNFRRLKRKFAIIPYELFLELVEKLRG
jgi:hypothetical protein